MPKQGMLRRALAAGALCLVCACNARSALTEGDEGGDAAQPASTEVDAGEFDGGPSSADAAHPEAGCETRRDEVEPVAVGPVGVSVFTPEHLVEDANGRRLEARVDVDFLVGAAYPTEFVGEVRDRWFGACGELRGEFVLDAVDPADSSLDAVEVVVEGPDRARFSVRREGTALVTLRGRYHAPSEPEDRCAERFPPDSDTPWFETLSIRAAAPAGVEWGRPFECREGPLVAPEGAYIGNLAPTALAADGRRLSPVNASWRHPVAYELRACLDAPGPWPDPPAEETPGVQCPDAPGTLTLTPAVGAPLTIRVVGPRAVTTIDFAFSVAGFGGGPIPVADGARLGEMGWGRAARRVFPGVRGLHAGPDALCGAAPTRWFTVSAGPSEVCDTRPSMYDETPNGLYLIDGTRVGGSAYLVADGECTLGVSAPEADGGGGLGASITATFVRVDGMHDAP